MGKNRFITFQLIVTTVALVLTSGWLKFVPGEIGRIAPSNTALAESLPDELPVAITKELALERIKQIWSQTDQTKGLRALQYQEVLPAGTTVKPAFSIGSAPQSLTCESSCWLFFVDKAPGAHFSHPVSIILVDAEGNEQEMETEWWPEVAVPELPPKQLFNTRELRKKPELIIFDKMPLNVPDIQPENNSPQIPFTSSNALPESLTCEGCLSSAILVCGFDDLPDTFDEDTNGMYAVLKSLGLSDDNIYYLSPHSSHPGVDRPTSKANVQWAINEVADKSCENDKVLFFYSSHGGVNGVSCISESISSFELDSWLDAITYKELAVIIEACHSGSFIGMYKDGTYVEAEDELTNTGENGRVVFTSASTDTSSYPDVDGSDDPNEATDIGSESVYGYVMSFSIPGTDTNADGAVSFLEGVDYAMANDVTFIRGDNVPQFSNTADLDPARVHHYCYPTSDPNGPYSRECVDGATVFALDGSASFAPPPCDGTLSFSWETNCHDASFSDPTEVSPTLTLSPINQCFDCDVRLTVTCSDGSTDTRVSSVTTMDHTPPAITCPVDLVVECDQSTGPSNTGTAEATDNCDGALQVVYTDLESPGACGQTRTISRLWTATDGCGNENSCSQIIEVVDTTPPVIESAASNPNTLWPPNHAMYEASISAVATDNCSAEPRCSISGVTSNEPINGLGDGDTAPDWLITGDLSLNLRAERSGIGDDRIYTVEVTCTDECGNNAATITTVTVSHNM